MERNNKYNGSLKNKKYQRSVLNTHAKLEGMKVEDYILYKQAKNFLNRSNTILDFIHKI